MENEKNYTPETEEQTMEAQTPAEVEAAVAEEPVCAEEAATEVPDEGYTPDEEAVFDGCEPQIQDETVYEDAVPAGPDKKKILLPIIIGAAAVFVIIVAVFTFAVMNMLNNPQRYIDKGDYQKAYDVAKEDEKYDVLYENIVATISADCVDRLKDEESFELEGAWINDLSKVVIMRVRANNSYGNKVLNYWYYSYNDEDQIYKFIDSYVDFSEEKVNSWDDKNERLEKTLNNLLKKVASGIVESGKELDDESVDSINNLFEKGLLDDVELLVDEAEAVHAEKAAADK